MVLIFTIGLYLVQIVKKILLVLAKIQQFSYYVPVKTEMKLLF